MRINDHILTVSIGLFLTVSVGVVVHNGESVMASFRGESNILAVDDIYTVRAGSPLVLPVLENDVNPAKLSRNSLRVSSPPQCGEVTLQGSTLTYVHSEECAGIQSFSYCVFDGSRCEPASVALRIVDADSHLIPTAGTLSAQAEQPEPQPIPLPAPKSSIDLGPTVEITGFDQQVDINGRDLEITNVRLGKDTVRLTTVGSDTPRLPADSAGLDSVEFTRPDKVSGTARVEGLFSLDGPDSGGPTGRVRPTARPAYRVASTNAVAPPPPPQSQDLAIQVPFAPDLLTAAARLPDPKPQQFFSRMASIDSAYQPLRTTTLLDRAPFGENCAPNMQLAVRESAVLHVQISLPCYPNSRIMISHGSLSFTGRTGHSGLYQVDIPAMDSIAGVIVEFGKGGSLRASINIPEVQNYRRVAILWEGAVELDLHAFERGDKKSGEDHVWSGQPRSIKKSRFLGGGYLTELGDASVASPRRVEIYTWPSTDTKTSGVVRFKLEARATPASCAKDLVVFHSRSQGGRLVVNSGYKYVFAECKNGRQTLVLKNALSDLIIAAN